MDPLSESHALLETATTPLQRGDEQGLGGFPLMKKLNERLRNFRIPLSMIDIQGWSAVYILSVCHYHCKLISKMVIDALWQGLSSTNAPSTTDRVLGDETLLYYTPVGIVAVMVLLGLLHFVHVIG
ncbi:hypothetical protein AAC387_Pa04g0489 [Persea americana]